MKHRENFQLLLERAMRMFELAKEIGRILSSFDAKDDCLNDTITCIARENRNQCARLEGLIAAIQQVKEKKADNEDVLKELDIIFKRIAHHDGLRGYDSVILLAVARGEFEIADQMRLALYRQDQVPIPLA